MSDQCCCEKLDPSGWSISQLKAFLATSNVSFTDCIEKSDFVEKVKSVMLAQESNAAAAAAAPSASGNMSSTSSADAFVFDSIKVGPLHCNCSLLIDTSTEQRHALLCDPGGDADQIRRLIAKHRATVVQILITHGHFDHFLAAAEIKKDFPSAQLCLGRADLPLWRALPMQMMMFGMALPQEASGMPEPDCLLDDNSELKLFNGRCLHTPGHSPGSCCFYFPHQALLLSGDTLFRLSVGRTDLFGGSAKQLTESIQQKLYTLPPNTKVIPGHNDFTTIGFELQNNPVVKAKI